MICLHLTRDNHYEGVYLQLPATPAEIGEAFAELDGISAHTASTRIVGAISPIMNIGQYIKSADVNEPGVLEKLNTLAEQIQRMGKQEKNTFSGALDAESINGLDDVLDIAGRLDQYILIHGVTNDKDLGGFLVKRGYKDFPERVRPYLDYAGIGAEYYAEHGGTYTTAGYVLRRSAFHLQAEQRDPVIRLWLRTMTSGGMILNLPATEEQMEAAKRALNVEEFAATQISKAEMHHYVAGYIPTDAICVEDANELAAAIDEMLQADDESLSKFLAVLAVERPDTFPTALRLAMEQDDYALVPDDPWEYGEQVLRRVCTDQEVLDTIDGFMLMMPVSKKKPRGHFCKVCGERKSNESFTGKGHASHICKVCSHLPPEQQAEQMTLNRLCGLPLRRLTEQELQWLKNRTRDKRPEVRELARAVYAERFPHAAHRGSKK